MGIWSSTCNFFEIIQLPSNKSTLPNVKLLWYNKCPSQDQSPFDIFKNKFDHHHTNHCFLKIDMAQDRVLCLTKWLEYQLNHAFPYYLEPSLVFLTTPTKSECTWHHIVQEQGHSFCNACCCKSKFENSNPKHVVCHAFASVGIQGSVDQEHPLWTN